MPIVSVIISNNEIPNNKEPCMKKTNKNRISRRNFIKASAAVSLAAALPGKERLFAAGSDKIRVGVIGCGEHGTSDVISCAKSAENVEITAMADVLKDRLDSSLQRIKGEVPDKIKVTDDTCFLGFDAYKKVLAANVDMVMLLTPPHFRPQHLAAAVDADKHVFMEKPGCVDPVGVRSLIASSEKAEAKGLSIVAGTQRRHQNHYIELMKRIHNGDIGEIVSGQCYWLWGSSDWHMNKRQPGWSDLEWQIRSWPYFTWLSGDHIVEQHVHNIDVINWAMGTHPVKCLAMGGRQARTGPEYGNIYDHFAVEFEYPNGVRVASMSSQIQGTTNRENERIVGTKGVASGQGIIEGQNPFKYDGEQNNPYVQEMADLIASIRNGEPVNEGRNVAESTMTAIMGRISAYTGRAVSWDWVMNASELDLSPAAYDFDIDLPVRPVAIPGKTKLI
jgi:predicted dehydrogenase